MTLIFFIPKKLSISFSTDPLSTFSSRIQNGSSSKVVSKLNTSAAPPPAFSPTTAPVNRSFQNLHRLPVPWRTQCESGSSHLQNLLEVIHPPRHIRDCTNTHHFWCFFLFSFKVSLSETCYAIKWYYYYTYILYKYITILLRVYTILSKIPFVDIFANKSSLAA